MLCQMAHITLELCPFGQNVKVLFSFSTIYLFYKGFYLLLYSIALRTLSFSSLGIFSILNLVFKKSSVKH